MEVLDEGGLSQIEENAETILSEIGIAFQDFPVALRCGAQPGPRSKATWSSSREVYVGS